MNVGGGKRKGESMTENERRQAEKYRDALPKQFGNLHQRMKHLIALAERDHATLPVDLWHAIMDLRTEVMYHRPANPPYGRRGAT